MKVYRWCLKEYDQFKSWCTSPYCKEVDGKFIDIYWGLEPSDNNKILNPEEIELEYLGDLDGYDKVNPYPINYNPKDIIDLTHSNCMRGLYYLRKDSKECVDTQIKNIKEKISETKRDIEYQKYKLERLEEELNAYPSALS